MNAKRGNWRKLSSKVVYKNPYYAVREDTVIRPNGSKGSYYVVAAHDSVFIVALDKQHNVYLVELHRYTNNNLSIEVPAGAVDDQDPLTAAQRELQEETGLVAGTWKKLGYVHPDNGTRSSTSHIFLATDLRQTKDHEQEEEGIIRTIKIPIKEALLMIKNGEITDAESIAPLTMAALELGLLSD